MAERDESRCFHCGEALPAAALTAEFDGAARRFCCSGCAAAAAFIRDAGLGDYYRLRSGSGKLPTEGDFSVWDRDDLMHEHSTVLGDSREITLVSNDMHCAACAWLVDRALRREAAVEDVQANAITGRIRLRWQPARQPLSALLRRLAGLGYGVHLAPDPRREAARLRERRTLMIRLGIAALGSMQAMMLAEALYLDIDNSMQVATRDFFRWITLLVSTPVVFYSGWPFIAGWLRELRLRRAGMDSLVAVSVLLAWGASAAETIRGGPHVWYDAAVMFVFFLLAARSLEGFARQRANAVVERLARARPDLAVRLADDGSRERVPLAALRTGDRVEVPAGGHVPADGRLLDAGEFDESLLSGESRPQPRAAGETIVAGSVCLSRPVRMQVERTGSDTRLSQLVRIVENAQNQRPWLAQRADRIAGGFVIGLFVAAALTWLGWQAIDPARAFEVALSILVVSCPCALSLAIPTALVTAHASLARVGLLALGADGLDMLGRVDTVVFDKTGTLSAGRPALRGVTRFAGPPQATLVAIAAALERAVQHPLAAAFRHDGTDAPRVEDCRLAVGHGVEGRVDGGHYRLGKAPYATGTDDDGALWLADVRQQPLARFDIEDALRPEAAAAITRLRALGIHPHIASGDAATRVAATAQALGIGDWHARQLPEDKLALMRRLQAQGHRVLAVGDGINDGPVLAGADVSIALGGGASLAHRAADFVLAQADLGRIPEAIALARRSRRIMRQNLAWALFYNLVALPFAMLGLVPPWLAALGMTTSSLLVTLNALRLGRPAAASAVLAAPAAIVARTTP